jgi:PAS domain S-box-containing protein
MVNGSKEIRILFVEDMQSDYDFAIRILNRGAIIFKSHRVYTAESMLTALHELRPHIIISDYSMPQFNGMEALKLAIKLAPQIPFIMLTGSLNEGVAVECMKAGAIDYVIKESITRLPFAVKEALERSRVLKEKAKTEFDLVKSEAKYRNLVENSLVGIYTTNTKGVFQFVNSSMSEILEFDSPEDLVKTNFSSLIKNLADNDKFFQTLKTERKLVNYEIEMVSTKGNPKNINVSAVRNGRTISGMLLDITDKKLAEMEIRAKNHEIEIQNEEYRTLNQKLLVAKEKAEESDRLKTAFIQNLSHEIRTPLNGILGFADILKRKTEISEILSQYIEVIEKSGDRLMNLIRDLLEISKIETGQVTTTTEKFNLNATLTELHLKFANEAEEKGLKLSVSNKLIDSESIIISDKGKVSRVLSNLLMNAIKFTESGTIDFGCIRKDDMLEFYVNDTGIGIDPSFHCSIFERFFQANTSLSNGYEGSGMGLSISKAFVEILDGKIWVESEANGSSLGPGSTFFFTLPYNTPES